MVGQSQPVVETHDAAQHRSRVRPSARPSCLATQVYRTELMVPVVIIPRETSSLARFPLRAYLTSLVLITFAKSI